jgi:transcriptional regulator with XRE-family HTH domain
MDLQQWRESKGLNQAEAAKRLDLSQATVSRIENGEQFPPPETIEALSKKTGGAITAADLFAAWQAAQAAPPPKRGRPRAEVAR